MQLNEKMRREIFIKVFAVFVSAVVVANIILFSFGKIDPVPFWIIIALSALIAYVLLPRIRNSQ